MKKQYQFRQSLNKIVYTKIIPQPVVRAAISSTKAAIRLAYKTFIFPFSFAFDKSLIPTIFWFGFKRKNKGFVKNEKVKMKN